jgi:hypothetical protein
MKGQNPALRRYVPSSGFSACPLTKLLHIFPGCQQSDSLFRKQKCGLLSPYFHLHTPEQALKKSSNFSMTSSERVQDFKTLFSLGLLTVFTNDFQEERNKPPGLPPSRCRD